MCIWGHDCQAHMSKSEDDFVECILSFIFTRATESNSSSRLVWPALYLPGPITGLAFSFVFSLGPRHMGWCYSHLRWIFHSLLNLSQTHYEHAHRCVSMAIPHIRWLVKLNLEVCFHGNSPCKMIGQTKPNFIMLSVWEPVWCFLLILLMFFFICLVIYVLRSHNDIHLCFVHHWAILSGAQ